MVTHHQESHDAVNFRYYLLLWLYCKRRRNGRSRLFVSWFQNSTLMKSTYHFTHGGSEMPWWGKPALCFLCFLWNTFLWVSYESKQNLGLHQKDCGQQVEGVDSPTPLCPVRPHPECWVQFWCPHHKKHRETVGASPEKEEPEEEPWRRAGASPPQIPAEKAGAVQPEEEEVPVGIQSDLTGPEGDAGKPEKDSSSETVVIGQRITGTNWKRGNLC